jgi:hypothetical protein
VSISPYLCLLEDGCDIFICIACHFCPQFRIPSPLFWQFSSNAEFRELHIFALGFSPTELKGDYISFPYLPLRHNQGLIFLIDYKSQRKSRISELCLIRYDFITKSFNLFTLKLFLGHSSALNISDF